MLERKVHQEHHQGDDQGSYGHNNHATSQFAPGRPGDLFRELNVALFNVVYQFHLTIEPLKKHGRKGSNSRHSVLETDALPTELRP